MTTNPQEIIVMQFYTWLRDEYPLEVCRKDNPDISFTDYLELALRGFAEMKWGTGFPK